MTDRNYIHEVDALRAPDALRAKIGALPLGGETKKRRFLSARWFVTAALALAVGLGAAMPRLFPDLFAGGQLEPPPTATMTPAIGEAELTALLTRTVTNGGPQDEITLLYGSRFPNRTLGIVKYTRHGSGMSIALDQNMILLGSIDNVTGKVSGETFRFDGGMSADMGVFVPQADSDGLYILCTGWYHGQGRGENATAALFRFDGQAVTQVKNLPGVELPPEVLGLLDPERGGESAGYDHQLLIAPGGVELFERNPAFSLSASDPLVPRWLFVRYIPLDKNYPEPRAMEGVRQYLETYYAERFGPSLDSWDISSEYTISTFESVSDYRAPDYPDALVYHAALRHSFSGKAGPEWYFLFDPEYRLLRVRDIP